MRKLNFKLLFLAVLFFGIFGLAKNSQAATSWYVDNSVSASGNGQAWGTAWKNFANINWASVACGDTIYISGGSTGSSQEYSEMLKIENKNCAQASPLTITVGTDTSHNGTVQITGAAGLNRGILLKNSDWVTIDGQSGGDGNRHIEIYQKTSCTNCVTSGVSVGDGNVSGGRLSGIKLKYLYVHDIGGIGNDYTRAIYFGLADYSYVHDHEVAYCLIEKTIDAILISNFAGTKPTKYGGVAIHHNTIKAYDDGVQTTTSIDIYNNNFIRDTYVGQGHPDGMQIYGSYVRIYNNTFTGFLDQPSGNSVIYIEPDGGENMDVNEHQPSNWMIYNNVFNETGSANTSVGAISLGLGDSRFISLRDLYIFNNSFKGDFSIGIGLSFGSSDKVLGTNGKTYISRKSHAPSLDNRPITGANWNTYWSETVMTGGVAWAQAATPAIVSNNGVNYICKLAHTTGASTEPGVGISWASYWTETTDASTGPWASGVTLSSSQCKKYSVSTVLDSSAVSNIVIENNLFYNAAASGHKMMFVYTPEYLTTQATYGGHGSGAGVIVDYNQYFRNNDPADPNKQIVFNGKYYNYSNFVNLNGSGMQTHPSNATSNPNINTSDLKPLSASLTVNAGADLSFIPGLVDTKDKNGVARSAGAWDIGAYEYVSDIDTTPPSPPTGLAVI